MEYTVSFTREEEGRCADCRGDGFLLSKEMCTNCHGTGGADNEYECTAQVWATPGSPLHFDVGFGNYLPGDPEEFQLISMCRNDTGEELTEEPGDETRLRDNFYSQLEAENEQWI